MIVDMKFDQKDVQGLRSAYDSAVQKGLMVFDFKHHEVLTSYAKYLLEYLETRFEYVESRK